MLTRRTLLAGAVAPALLPLMNSGAAAFLPRLSADMVQDFGADPTGSSDSSSAMANAASALSAAEIGSLSFPAGIYKYDTSPNWAIANARIDARGDVRLRYTGTGHAVILDGGASGPGIYNAHFGRFIVEAPHTAQNAVYCRALHHSDVSVKVLGAAWAGLRTEWCVLTDFWVTVSVNEEGWYGGGITNRPLYGIYLASRGAGETTSYCNFYNATVDGVGNIGIVLDGALGNNFFGGVAEACAYGMYGGGGSGDKFWGMDFEVNTVADIYIPYGLDIRLIECDSDGLTAISTNSRRICVIGGNYAQLTIDGNANSTLVDGVKYNRFNTGKTLADGGVNTRISNSLNVGTGVWHP